MFQFAVLAGPDHNEARRIEAGRRHDVENGAVLPCKAVGSGSAANLDLDARERLLCRRAELQIFAAERNKNPAQPREWYKTELERIGHHWSFSAAALAPFPGHMNRTAAPCKAVPSLLA